MSSRVEIDDGFLNVLFSNGDFRKLKADNVEFIQRIYFAVRDEEWLNVPYSINNFQQQATGNETSGSYNMFFDDGHIQFHAAIEFVIVNGSITIEAKGKTLSDFKKNRIGFCVHLPASLQSTPCAIRHTDNTKTVSAFPHYVSPYQPFKNIRAIEWMNNNREVKIYLEGDVFEMEDQRNWTDASYKIYSTPLDMPFPVQVNKGEDFYQKISISISKEKITVSDWATHTFSKHLQTIVPCPAIGIAEPFEPFVDDKFIVDDKSSLPFSHYRVDFFLHDHAWKAAALSGIARANELKLPIYAVVAFGDNYTLQAKAFIDYIQSLKDSIVHSVCLLSSESFVLSAEILDVLIPLIRNAFPDALIGAGTDANFAQLNRNRPDTLQFDFLCYSIQPQEHASDVLSIVENIQGQADTVATAKSFSNEKPVHIAGLSFFRRFNANISFVAVDKFIQYKHWGSNLEAAWFIGSMYQLIVAGAGCFNCFYALHKNSPLMKSFIYMAQNPPEVFYTYGSHHPEQYAVLSWKSRNKRHSIFANLTEEVLEINHPFGSIILEPYESRAVAAFLENKI